MYIGNRVGLAFLHDHYPVIAAGISYRSNLAPIGGIFDP